MTDKILLMINGLPGNVAGIIYDHAAKDDRFTLIPFSLTGPEISFKTHTIKDMKINLITPDKTEEMLPKIKKDYPGFITIDFTHPTAVNANAELYVKFGLPFVMGTTGGDRKKLEETVLRGHTDAVIAPNMAKQIVGFQAMMAYAAETFPDLFKGYSLEIRESHQQGKADTSGTAKAMVTYFNRLGIPFSEDQIQKERNPEVQKNEWQIPENHISGHAWHTYTLTSPDGSACFEFSHNINGRDIYAQGTMDAVVFLHKALQNKNLKNKLKSETKGKVYTMIDVLKD